MRRELLQKLGSKALEMINNNIAAGISYDNERYSYSDRPFYMPFSTKVYDKLGRRNEGSLYNIVHSRRTGKLGFIILGGYKAYKAKMNPSAADDFLTWSGQMLRNLQIVQADGQSVILGFTDPEQEQKAFWLEVSGAGRSRKLWKFLGITDSQQQELIAIAINEMTADDLAPLVQLGLNKYR